MGKIRMHLAHEFRETFDCVAGGGLSQIVEDFVAIDHVVRMRKRSVEERLQVVCFIARRDGVDYLIEVQITKVGRRRARFRLRVVFRSCEKDAAETHARYASHGEHGSQTADSRGTTIPGSCR